MQTMPQTLPWPMRPALPPLNKTHVAIAVAVSLLLHLVAALWAWQHQAAVPHFATKTTVSVHLLPLSATPEALPPLPDLSKPDKDTARHNPHTAPHAAAPAIVATPTRVEKDQPPVDQPVAPAQEKHLNMNAVYGSVKSAMTQIDRENADTPVGQLAAKPLNPPESGNKIGKMIDKTTRADCKEQVEGSGLWTPILAAATLLDKKDSGCKWR